MNDLPAAYQTARRHLSRRDAVLRPVIAGIGPCTLRTEPDGFLTLTRAIVAQLISTRAAETIFARLLRALGRRKLGPRAILAVGTDPLRAAGLSGSKVKSLQDLAERVLSRELPLDQLPKLSDDEAIDRLVAVRGIGRWTAEMFLIFSLGRLDVLPVGDFGLRAGVRDAYGLVELPNKTALTERAVPWQPYRSIATWYLWRSRGGVPQSD